MNFEDFKKQKYYNFFVSADEAAWNSNSYIMSIDRCLTSYTHSKIKQIFDLSNSQTLKTIQNFPCLFVCEKGIDIPPRLGYLTNIKVRPAGIKFEFEKIRNIPFNILEELAFELDIDITRRGITELMHTHWTIKEVNLYEELSNKISFNGISKNKIEKPTVFISYCWSPKENKDRVDKLVAQLQSDGVDVLYDQNTLKPGHDMISFMERLATNTKIKKVLVICNKDYVEKANSRTGGVGTESEIIIPQVFGHPMQDKIIPVFFEKDENRNPIIPTYLKSRYGIDLTFDNESLGYNQLLSDIFG